MEPEETPAEETQESTEDPSAQEGAASDAPAAEDTSVNDQLPDELVWRALADPRAAEYIQLVTTSQTPPAMPVVSDASNELDDLRKRASEGDEEAAAQYGLRVIEQEKLSKASEATFAEARKRVYESSLGSFEELQNLEVPEKMRLLKAYQSGDAEFMKEAVNIITSKRTPAAPSADPAKAEALAARNSEIAAAQGAKAPALPAAQNPGGPPPIDTSKSVIDVFDEFFEYEASQAKA